MPVFAQQPAFSRGEISPRLWSRADISHYALALKECTNFTVMRQGGLTRRTGTQFINEVKNSSQRVRLIDFVFSTQQAYVLEFGHLYMRVYASGGIVTSGGSPVEIATPYTQEEIFDLHYVQSADVLYIAHPQHFPQKISRTSDTSWSITDVVFKDGPYLDTNDTATTLTPASTGLLGIVHVDALEASGTQEIGAAGVCSGYTIQVSTQSIDDAPCEWTFEGFNGSAWIGLDTQSSQTGWSRGETRFYELNNKVSFQKYRVVWSGNNGAEGTVFAIALTQSGETQTPFNLTASSTTGINNDTGFQPSDVGRPIRLLGGDGRWRWAQIVSWVSSTVVTVRLFGFALPNVNPVASWRLGAFSTYSGFPGRVGFYQERLVWARTSTQPQTVWFSKTSILDDYGTSQPVLADDGLSFTILSESVNEIKWVKEGSDLLIGTSAGIRSLGPSDNSNAFAPDNVLQRRHVNYGSSDMQPVEVGQVTLYVDRFRKGVREAMYSFENDSIVAPEVTVLSEHIFGRGISDLAYQASPVSVLWLVLDTGELAGITYEREQEMFATHVHRLGGRFGADDFGHVESVAAIPGDNGDELWLIVKRTINGQTRRYVERLSEAFDGDLPRAFFVDCGLTYDGAPTSTFSGLGHLEGEEVAILGDGAVFPSRTVVGGQVSLQDGEKVSKASIGLPYHSQIHTLDPGVSRGDGSGLGRRKKITKVMVDLYETGQLMGRTAGSAKAETIVLRSTSDLMDEPVPLTSGWKTFRPDGGWGEAPGEVVLFVDLPVPASIRSVTPVIEPEP